MKWRTTVVLLVVALGLVLYLAFFERKLPTTTEVERQRQRLFSLSAEDVDRLQLTHGEVSVTLERGEEEGEPRWRMTEPLRVRASRSVCEQLTRDLESLQWQSRLAGAAQDPEKVAERGLDKPRATLSFRYEGGEETLYLGDDTPVGSRVYLRVEGRADLYEVRRSFLTSLLKDLEDFRDPDVLVFEVPEVERLSVTRRVGRLTLRREDRRWLLSDPLPAAVRADRDQVRDALRKLAALRVERFVADAAEKLSQEELSRYGLAEPVLTAELEVPEAEPLTISFGAPVPERSDQRYATTSEAPSVYAVKAEAAELLARPAVQFRDRQLTPLTPDRVQTLTLRLALSEEGQEPQTVEVVRKEGSWRLRKPRDIEADEEAVRELLRDLDTRTVVDFVQDFAQAPEAEQLAPYGLDKPRVTITLSGDAGEEETFYVGARDPEGGRGYLRRGEEPSVVAVEEDFFDLATRGYLAYRTKKLLEVSRYDVTRILIERPAGRVVLTKEKNDWKLTEPTSKRAERSAVDDLLLELAPLNAERILAEEAQDLASYGLDKPAYRLEWTVKKEGEAPETTVLSLGEQLPQGGRAARIDEKPLVVALPQTFVEKLEAEFRYRTVLTFDRDRADQLTITGLTPEVRAEKSDGTWKLTQPADRGLDQTRLGDLLDRLKKLRVERWDTYQAEDLAPYGLDEPAVVVSVHVGGLEPTTHTLMFGDEAEGGSVFARLEADPGVFLLPKRLLEQVRKSILQEPEPEPEAESKAGEPPPGEPPTEKPQEPEAAPQEVEPEAGGDGEPSPQTAP